MTGLGELLLWCFPTSPAFRRCAHCKKKRKEVDGGVDTSVDAAISQRRGYTTGCLDWLNLGTDSVDLLEMISFDGEWFALLLS